MTWVVGGRHVFCVRCIADVQVTLEYPDGRKEARGYVQKVHKISDDIVIAFADCIRLAFVIINAVRNEYLPRFDRRLLWSPDLVMKDLRRFIRYKYRQKRRAGERVELMIFIRPRNILTISFGLWKCVSPQFIPETSLGPFDMLEIGSGSVAPEYRDLIERSSKGVLEVPGEEGEKPTAIIPVGKIGLQWVFAEALEHQVAGVSHSMHVMLLHPGGALIKERPREPEGVFPDAARSWDELVSNLRQVGVPMRSCRAMA